MRKKRKNRNEPIPPTPRPISVREFLPLLGCFVVGFFLNLSKHTSWRLLGVASFVIVFGLLQRSTWKTGWIQTNERLFFPTGLITRDQNPRAFQVVNAIFLLGETFFVVALLVRAFKAPHW